MVREQASRWWDQRFNPEDALRRSEEIGRAFRAKARKVAASLPFAHDLVAAYYCAFDRDTPLQVKAALLGAIAYFVLPFDFLPDVMPLLGFTDDAAILAVALRMVSGHINDNHRAAARRALAEGFEAEQD